MLLSLTLFLLCIYVYISNCSCHCVYLYIIDFIVRLSLRKHDVFIMKTVLFTVHCMLTMLAIDLSIIY